MDIKKVLIITPFPPNKITAGQSITNTVIDDLSKKHYIVDVIAFTYPGHSVDRPERCRNIRLIENNRLIKYFYAAVFIPLFPFYTIRFSSRVCGYLISKQSQYDVIYLDYSQMFIYSLFICNKRKLFIMCHDLILQRFSRATEGQWYKRYVQAYIFYSEKFFFKRSGNIFFPSHKDKCIAKKIYGVNGVAIIPKSRFNSVRDYDGRRDLKLFAFLGSWNRQENIQGLLWFIENVHPLLGEDVEFIIIGGNMSAETQNALPASFKYLGFVDDFAPYLQCASALISPLFLGAGIKFKVLDALSNGCRVIGTPISFEGITVCSHNAMLFANVPNEFVTQINHCIRNSFDKKEIQNAFNSFLNSFTDVAELI
ncbi:glycosyltransferase [Foetidibacter luteolus]|uniref:glycosyltransferase n=1 Tax=Foetidibacter luteolus TaxID=2608880 RepID=UPI00129B560E|nr:glycosyltransferase [Foetidibacter luteolus]